MSSRPSQMGYSTFLLNRRWFGSSEDPRHHLSVPVDQGRVVGFASAGCIVDSESIG